MNGTRISRNVLFTHVRHLIGMPVQSIYVFGGPPAALWTPIPIADVEYEAKLNSLSYDFVHQASNGMFDILRHTWHRDLKLILCLIEYFDSQGFIVRLPKYCLCVSSRLCVILATVLHKYGLHDHAADLFLMQSGAADL